MSIPTFCVSWNSFNNNICNGFSNLRQHEEFVDMTLAAEGHLIKVHQNLIALASPYLKEMLQSAPCHHPVIFLNNVKHKVLSYIIEYIYNGEVQVPGDMLSAFLEASMALHIRGVEHFVAPNINPTEKNKLPERSNFAAHITIDSQNFNLEVQQFDNNIDCDNSTLIENEIRKEPGNFPIIEINSSGILELQNIPATTDVDLEEIPQNVMDTNNSDITPQLLNLPQNTITIQKLQPQPINQESKVEEIPTVSGLTGLPLYTISNRGSLQLILNRHLYYFHHQSCGGRKRRWRCIDYRRIHCPAFIDTDGEVIMRREGIHCHAHHDQKIVKKRRKNLVYKSIASVEIVAKHYNGNQLSGDEDEIDMQVTESKNLGIMN